MIGRTFAVLGVMAENGTPVRLSEIARRTGLPKSTVHRLLAELRHQDVVSRIGDRYEMGTMMRRLIAPTGDEERRRLCRVLKPLLISVHVRTRYLVALGMAADSTVQFVDLAYSHEYSSEVEQIEQPSCLHTSAAGKALLAYDPGLVVNLAARQSRNGAQPGVLPRGLIAEMNQIRRDGIASHFKADLNVLEMGIPLFGASRRPVAALSVGAYRTRFDPGTAKGVLRRASVQADVLLREGGP